MPAINSEKPLHKNIVSYIKIDSCYLQQLLQLFATRWYGNMSGNKYVLMASLPEKRLLMSSYFLQYT